jgi:putative ABC transport system permease protein
MVLWKFTLRELKNRPGRAILTLLSIVIGVAAIVSVNVTTTTTHAGYQELYRSFTGRVALEVVKEDGGTYEAGIAAQSQQTPGVKQAVPVFRQPTKVYLGDQKLIAQVVGLDFGLEGALDDYQLEAGSLDLQGESALVEAGFAHGLGLNVGDAFRIQVKQVSLHTLSVAGLVVPKGAGGVDQVGKIILPLATVQELYKQPGSINVTQLILHDGADEKQVKAAVAAGLPAGLAVRQPVARTQLAKETFQDAEKVLAFAYALALGLAAFTILNTFLMNVSERRKQLAILRALGGTRRQVMGMLLREGLLMGVAGTLIGSLLGLGGAVALNRAMAQAYSSLPLPLHITPAPFLVAALLGPGVSLLAVYIPAWLASRITPMEGMRPMIAEASKPVPAWVLIAGLSIPGVTTVLIVACTLGYLPTRWLVPVGAMSTFAFVPLLYVVIDPMTRWAAAILMPLLGTEGRLAQRQILRRRTRTVLTVGMLFVAVASGISLGTMVLNTIQDIRNYQAKTMVGDLFVRASFPDTTTGKSVPMPESLRADIAAVAGIAGIDTLRMIDATTVDDRDVKVALREFSRQATLPLDLKVGAPDDVRRRLIEGEVVVGEVLASRGGLSVGDTLTLQTNQGEKTLRIAATTTEYMVGGRVVQMDRDAGKRLFGDNEVDVFLITAQPEMLASVEGQLQQFCKEHGLLLHSFVDLRRRLDGMTNSIVGAFWGLLGLGFVVVAFAIANTLTMNVLEQTRDLALLRVVAMTRHQVRKTILAQAVIIGAIAIALGIVVGMCGSYTTNLCSYAELGHTVPFAMHPGLLATTFVVALSLVVVVAWIPAVRASRLNLLIALRYE